jgi:hypothetical protein
MSKVEDSDTKLNERIKCRLSVYRLSEVNHHKKIQQRTREDGVLIYPNSQVRTCYMILNNIMIIIKGEWDLLLS